MPGILPMKVIKVGNSAQSRIAQACDRCRSKKIRCDGTRPTCSQCATVGFECRTSDKLSRRAFPRGYTESLEERVRVLEAETRELKDLLDEKDEKIDMLSAMHGNRRRSSVTSVSHVAPSPELTKEASSPAKDTFRVQASPLLLGVENSDSYFMGASSGRNFISAFKRRLQETGKPSKDFNPEAFLHIQGCQPLPSGEPDEAAKIPPRIFTDRCVNVYFQEWAPLFPVLHKPTFLRIYEEFVADHEKVKCNYKLAQLYLVFSLAGLSFESPDVAQVAACEQHWTKALNSVILENTMGTLQCLILALLYCTIRADYKRLQHYKSIAVGLSHRLGLHQTQKRFSFGALTVETRKKVFWTLYTLDCFTAATIGLPKLFKEDDIQAEYPSDTDDEYITEKGFQPTLPGEYTRLSSALALFRATRILAKVLEKNYPASSTYDLSLSQMGSLESELDSWYDELPSHLRLNFVQGKPSTDITGSRSPLLALAYYFIRNLIYRPAVGSTLGNKAAPAVMSISESSKHMIQIVQLLEERNLTFSFCVNKCDLMALCGTTLLYQVLDLKHDSKVMRDNERLVNVVIKRLDQAKAPCSIDLRRVASALISLNGAPVSAPSSGTSSRKSSLPAQSSRSTSPKTSKKKPAQPASQPSRNTGTKTERARQQENMRRMTMPQLMGQQPDMHSSRQRQSFDIETPGSSSSRQGYRSSVSGSQGVSPASRVRPNLDYLSLSNTPLQSQPTSPPEPNMHTPSPAATQHEQMMAAQFAAKMSAAQSADWEVLLGSMDGGMNNVYDAIYGGGGLVNDAPLTANPVCNEWSPNSWDLSTFNIGDMTNTSGAPQSVLSISDESLSSGEEVAPSELGLSVGSAEYKRPAHGGGESFGLEGIEGFAL